MGTCLDIHQENNRFTCEKSGFAVTAAQSHLAPSANMFLDSPMVRSALPPKKDSDVPGHEDLLLRVGKTRDREAFIALFQYFAPRIKSYLLKHGASESAAEEAVQNTFVTVWEKAASYDPRKAAASTWIFTIARNKRIDALRREKYIESVDEDTFDNLAAPEEEAAYADAPTVEKLHDALDGLPPEQAELLRMAFFDDKSHQTIADETSLPLGTVKSRLRLGLQKLHQALKPKGKTS